MRADVLQVPDQASIASHSAQKGIGSRRGDVDGFPALGVRP